MTMTDSGLVRAVAAAQAGAGALLLIAPQGLLVRSRSGGPIPTWIVRLLGGRLVIQAGVETIHPTSATALGSAAVDLTHALSMLAVAMMSRRHRQAALRSAAFAATSAAVLVIARATKGGVAVVADPHVGPHAHAKPTP
jgi:hypothetical protein